MAKLNKAGVAKRNAQSRQLSNGCLVIGSYGRHMDSGGVFKTQYELGHQAWYNGTPLSKGWHLHKQQGWKNARDSDISFAEQCPAARKRVMARLGLLDEVA